MLIALNDVRAALSACLGERLAQTAQLCEHAAGLLRGYVPHQSSLRALQAELEDALFTDLYAVLGPSMLMQDARGHWTRLKTETLTEAADCCLAVLFRALPATADSLELLRDYAMREGSVSAMQVLLEQYAGEVSEMEKGLLQRVVDESGRKTMA